MVTNCSEALGATAVSCTGLDFDVVVTAERAGYYKPDPRPYEQALAELGMTASRCLFVAGSAYDLFGASRIGLPTYWHDRIGMTPPANHPEPLAHHRSLRPLLDVVRRKPRSRHEVRRVKEADLSVKLFALTCGRLSGDLGYLMEGGEGRADLPIPAYLIEHPKGQPFSTLGCIPIASMIQRRGSERASPASFRLTFDRVRKSAPGSKRSTEIRQRSMSSSIRIFISTMSAATR